MCEVSCFAACIQHNVELILVDFGDDAVIQDRALFRHQKTEACLTRLELLSVYDCHSLEQFARTRPTFDPDLTHVRNVENPRGSSRVEMLFLRAKRVVQRHLVAAKRHHLRALIDMKIEECGLSLTTEESFRQVVKHKFKISTLSTPCASFVNKYKL